MTPPTQSSPPAKAQAFLSIRCNSGPSQYYELTERITTIGRSRDNVLEIPDKNMSRRHSVIERRDDGVFIITDCNSSNGTVVNEERILSRELDHGDVIECGQTRIEFVYDDPAGAHTVVGKTKGAEESRADMQRKTAELGVVLGQREDLRKLLAINKELNKEHELKPLLERIIDSAIELMAAERGYLILADQGEMKIEIARGLVDEDTTSRKPKVSRQICNEVMETGRAVLTTNAQSDETYRRYQSVVGLGLRSILCVPFKIKDTVLGVLYLDNDRVGAFSELDVELLEAFSDQAAVAIDNARLIRGMKQKERLEQEMRTAAEIQAKLLPRRVPELPGLRLAGRMIPAKDVGGDYYDFVTLDDDSVLVAIGDVSGKGVPAGLIMATARSMIRSLATRVSSPRELLIDLNRLLADDLDLDMFMSLLLLRYESRTGRLCYASAGHEHLVFYRGADRSVESRKAGGVVLGVTADITPYLTETELPFAPGDALVLYTDGVTEAFDRDRRQFDLEGIEAGLGRLGHLPPGRCLEGLLDELMDFVGKTPQSDDITLVVLKRDDQDSPE